LTAGVPQDVAFLWPVLEDVAGLFFYDGDGVHDAQSFARWFRDHVEYAFVAFTQDWRPVACSYLTHVRPGVKGSFHGFATEEYRHPKYSVPVSIYAINHFFDFFDFRRLESVIAVDNIPAVIHATRLGFEWDGVLKEHYQRNDAWVDCHIGTKMRGEK